MEAIKSIFMERNWKLKCIVPRTMFWCIWCKSPAGTNTFYYCITMCGYGGCRGCRYGSSPMKAKGGTNDIFKSSLARISNFTSGRQGFPPSLYKLCEVQSEPLLLGYPNCKQQKRHWCIVLCFFEMHWLCHSGQSIVHPKWTALAAQMCTILTMTMTMAMTMTVVLTMTHEHKHSSPCVDIISLP